jgi:hypothetical protein
VEVAGRTFPAKPGSFVQFSDDGRVAIRSDGTYRGVVRRDCATKVPLVGYVPPSHRNESGDTRPQEAADTSPHDLRHGADRRRSRGADAAARGVQHRHHRRRLLVRRAGHRESDRPTGHLLERPPVHGVRAVPGPAQRHDRGARSGGHDGRRAGAQEQTLQPGQEIRTPLGLVARNCEAPQDRPAFGSTFGPPLPPGRVVGVSVVLVGSSGTPWASNRVALDVG